jgi:C_GCAxxG_C_C family probable redox protein
MDHIELANSYHERGFNCAQSVLGAYYREFQLEEEIALRLAGGFGSGMGRLCQVCGALTGGFMVIGLRYGRWQEGPAHSQDTEETYRLVRLLASRFEERYGSLLCRELIGLDLNDPAQRQIAIDEGRFKTRCAGYVRDVAEMLQDLA